MVLSAEMTAALICLFNLLVHGSSRIFIRDRCLEPP